jgi:hypothetical protein
MPTLILVPKIKEILRPDTGGKSQKEEYEGKSPFAESSMRQAEDVIDEAQRAEYHRAPVQLAITPRSQLPDGIDHQPRG